MRLLVADKMDLGALEELKVLGIEIVSRPELTRETLPSALEGVGILVVRSTEVTGEAIARGQAAQPHRPRRRRGQHHRRRRRQRPRRLRRQLSGQERHRRRRADHGPDPGARPPPRRRHHRAARRPLGEDALLRRPRPPRPAHRHRRPGRHRARGAPARAGLRPRAARVVALAQPGPRRQDGRRLHPHPGRAGGPVRRASPSTCPLKPQTRGVIGRSVLEALPDHAIVVNTARAEVLDYEALADLIPKKGLRVGLDVFAGEPEKGSAPFASPLLGLRARVRHARTSAPRPSRRSAPSPGRRRASSAPS